MPLNKYSHTLYVSIRLTEGIQVVMNWSIMIVRNAFGMLVGWDAWRQLTKKLGH